MKKLVSILLVCFSICLVGCANITSDELYAYAENTYSTNRNNGSSFPTSGQTFGDKMWLKFTQKMGWNDSIVEDNTKQNNSIRIKDKEYKFEYTVKSQSLGITLDRDTIDLNYNLDICSDFDYQYLKCFSDTTAFKIFSDRTNILIDLDKSVDKQIYLTTDNLSDTNLLDFVKVLNSYDSRGYFENYRIYLYTDDAYIVYYMATKEFE